MRAVTLKSSGHLNGNKAYHYCLLAINLTWLGLINKMVFIRTISTIFVPVIFGEIEKPIA
jgi:hypothetical protein